MDLFVEKEFIEEFELDYFYSTNQTEIQRSIYTLFSEYTNVRLFLDVSENFISESELLSRFTDSNLEVMDNVNFEDYFSNHFSLNIQTLVFTKESKNWFQALKRKGALCFSYADYDIEMNRFLNATHFNIDLSDKDNIPVNWDVFRYLNKQTNFIIISDPYILCDRSDQKLINNLVPLLRNNLDKRNSYSIFIITEVDNDIERKIGKIYSSLNDYNVKLYVFNRIRQIETIKLHDRLIYSNYAISVCGYGFNLNIRKPVNSQVNNTSILKKYTYKQFFNHFRLLAEYICKLENFDHLSKPYKTNSTKSYNAFKEIVV